MGDACGRCRGAGWRWDGSQRIACSKCNPPVRVVPDPFRAKWVEHIPVDKWPERKEHL